MSMKFEFPFPKAYLRFLEWWAKEMEISFEQLVEEALTRRGFKIEISTLRDEDITDLMIKDYHVDKYPDSWATIPKQFVATVKKTLEVA